MSQSLLLDADAKLQKKQNLHTTDEGFVVETIWNERPYLDHMARMRQQGVQQSQGMRYLGTIPMGLLSEWLKEDPEILSKPDGLAKKLRQAEYSKLRAVDKGKF